MQNANFSPEPSDKIHPKFKTKNFKVKGIQVSSNEAQYLYSRGKFLS